MDMPLAIMVAVMNSVFILSGAGLIGYWMKLRHDKQNPAATPEQMEEIRDALDDLRDQLEPQIAELQERIDFAERALTDGTRRHEAAQSTPV